ncbi:immediate early response gene 2 protein-like [Notolabrus celidotus]|uniref:immediate early response gene 2 protein-like n=1 Tax=Notolabrus celidotus TaxID=1203425 RepID=UPI00148F4960|nr:immediate early response gene 2 protein-like [Notolabrus celidotus]
MEVSAEAKRVMVVALGKLYSSRTQRGGLRLHRSLLLTMVMKSARDIYHAAQAAEESLLPGCEQIHYMEGGTPDSADPADPAAQPEAQGPVPGEETGGERTELRHDAHTELRHDARMRTADNKENQSPAVGQSQHSRKRRGKAAVEPDFLPCKKAKLEQGLCPQPLLVSSVLNCSSELGSPQTPMPLLRVIAVC